MKLLKKRPIAIILTILIVALTTLISVNRSVSSVSQEIEAQFFSGVYLENEGYTQKSINSQLGKRIDAALGLVTIAKQYTAINLETDKLREVRLELIDADGITEMYTANEKLQVDFESLYMALLMQSDLTDDHRTSADNYAATFSGAQNVINDSNYNSIVSMYINKTLAAFPVNLLKNPAFVKYPEYFGLEG